MTIPVGPFKCASGRASPLFSGDPNNAPAPCPYRHLGNICRSPLAEGILQQKAAENNLDWVVDSAGTSSWHAGDKPDRRSIKVAQKYGIDLNDQRSRQFQVTDFQGFDIIYAMDASNYNNVRRMAQDETEAAKVRLILNEVFEGQNRTVPDPYWGDDGFEKVYQLLESACEAIIQKALDKTL